MWMIGSDGSKMWFQSFLGNSFTQVSGKMLHWIDLFGILMKLIRGIGQKAAAGGEHATGHVSTKLSVRFEKILGNFFWEN